MSRTKSDDAGMQQKEHGSTVDPHPPGEKKFPTGKLLKSKHLAAYQPDFARVILTEPAYSVSGAKEALDAALKGGRN